MVSRCREEERKKGIKEEKHGYHCTFPARTIQFSHKRKHEGRMLKTMQGVYYLHSMQFRSGISHRHRSANARMHKTVGDSRTRTRLGYREYPRQLRTRARTRGKNRDGGKVGYIKKKRERERMRTARNGPSLERRPMISAFALRTVSRTRTPLNGDPDRVCDTTFSTTVYPTNTRAHDFRPRRTSA